MKNHTSTSSGTNPATQRVDAERFKAEVEPETEWSRAYVDMEPCKDGEWVRYSDYAALLQQLAERDAEVARLNRLADAISRDCNDCANQRNEAMAKAVAAERAREEACEMLSGCLVVLEGLRTVTGANSTKVYECVESRGGALVNIASTVESIAAFLAANGGRDETK